MLGVSEQPAILAQKLRIGAVIVRRPAVVTLALRSGWPRSTQSFFLRQYPGCTGSGAAAVERKRFIDARTHGPTGAGSWLPSPPPESVHRG